MHRMIQRQIPLAVPAIAERLVPDADRLPIDSLALIISTILVLGLVVLILT